MQDYMNQTEQMNDNNKQVEEYPLWRILVTCFQGARKYPDLLKQKSSKKVCYFFFLLVISSLFSFIVPVTGYILGIGGIGNYIQNRVPEFTFQNGQLDMESPITYERDGAKIYVDTSVDSYTKADLDENMVVEMLVSKNNVMMLQNRVVQEMKLSELSPLSCSKQWLLNNIPLFYILIVGAYIFTYLSDAMSLLLLMVMLVLIGWLTSNVNQADLKFSQLFSLALFASTMQLLVQSVNGAIGIVSPLTANIIGVVWTAFVYFGAITWIGYKNREWL